MARRLQILVSIIAAAKAYHPIPLAVVYPLSEVSLRRAIETAAHGLVTQVLIGPIEQMAAAVGVARCRAGKAEALLKGCLHTDCLTHAAIADDIGLRTTRRPSHVFVLDVPTYAQQRYHADRMRL